ncbi:hypothetical protein E2P81_ATG06657 [Venturia nashicola]|nr:hypothetical protein E2P81_ATG06657 [Venturia nashicola]
MYSRREVLGFTYCFDGVLVLQARLQLPRPQHSILRSIHIQIAVPPSKPIRHFLQTGSDGVARNFSSISEKYVRFGDVKQWYILEYAGSSALKVGCLIDTISGSYLSPEAEGPVCPGSITNAPLIILFSSHIVFAAPSRFLRQSSPF